MSSTDSDESFLFTLAVTGVDLGDEAVVAALTDGDIEVYPAVVTGRSLLTFRLAAGDAREAVLTAAKHVRSQCPDVNECWVELDLVSISDIAERIGRPRESVRAWAVGSRGAGDFPVPLSVVGDGIRVWDWPSVNEWLVRVGIDGHDEERLLSRADIEASNVALRDLLAGDNEPARRTTSRPGRPGTSRARATLSRLGLARDRSSPDAA